MLDPEKQRSGVSKPRLSCCSECKKSFHPSPRLRSRQKNCTDKICQLKHRARHRRKYRRLNPESEKEYRDKVKLGRSQWFWKNYRKSHLKSTERNRLNTRLRKQLNRAGLQRQLDITQVLDRSGYFGLFLGFATSHRSLIEACHVNHAA